MTRRPRFLILGTAMIALALAAAPALAGTYVGGGTFVAKSSVTGTLVDDGGVVCFGENGDGIGGGCLPFPPENRDDVFIRVDDADLGDSVAFQVCIDNNGDGICGGPVTNPECPDQAFFSHSDGGEFFNALGPLPTSFLRGCPGGFAGYVVMLCSGVHEDELDGPHSHVPTEGTIEFATQGSGYGDFCGGGGFGGPAGENPTVAKAYRVI